tara:strand:+ start:345 stop:566 length:222 start_codon:yes stop_codon:yes gene_type:complete
MANKRLNEAQSSFSLEKTGFIIAGTVVGVFVGDALFPSVTLSVEPRVFAGIKGGVGAVLGLITHQIYIHVRDR